MTTTEPRNAVRTGPFATVARPRLLDQLHRTDAAVICLVAGAGFGKTVLARQWSIADGRPFVWLELHRTDNDPVVLMRQLIDVLGELMDLGEAADAARGPTPRFDQRVLPLLDGALDSVDAPFVLVVDEIEVLDVEAAELLDDVLTRLAGRAQALLIGRTMHPALRMARREADGSAARLGPNELAFTPEETEALVTGVDGVPDPGSVADLLDRTMGWPLGLRLASVAAHRGALPTDAGPATADREQVLRRYVDEELLGPLDDDDRTFLMESSVLEWLNGELCDRVLDRTDSAQRLDQLLGGGHVLFVAGSGPHGERYHPVLRSVLLSRLRTADPKQEQLLRRRTVAAYEGLGHHRTAIDAALAAADEDLAIETLFRHLPTIIFGGEYVSLARWLAAFSEERRHRSGLLAVAGAWLAVLTNRRDDLGFWLAAAEDLAVDGPLPDGSASFEIAMAAVRMVASLDGVASAAQDAGLVREAGRASSPWWGMAIGIESMTRVLAGLEPDPVRALRTAEFESRGLHASHATNCANLGFQLLKVGDTDDGLALVRDAVAEVADAALLDFPLLALVFCTQAYAEASADTPRRPARPPIMHGCSSPASRTSSTGATPTATCSSAMPRWRWATPIRPLGTSERHETTSPPDPTRSTSTTGRTRSRVA